MLKREVEKYGMFMISVLIAMGGLGSWASFEQSIVGVVIVCFFGMIANILIFPNFWPIFVVLNIIGTAIVAWLTTIIPMIMGYIWIISCVICIGLIIIGVIFSDLENIQPKDK